MALKQGTTMPIVIDSSVCHAVQNHLVGSKISFKQPQLIADVQLNSMIMYCCNKHCECIIESIAYAFGGLRIFVMLTIKK